jgi:hypothetical protein
VFGLVNRFIALYTFAQLGITGNTAISLMYTLYNLPLHTHTRILSLHKSYPGNGFIIVSLTLQITYEVFFSQPNSFLAIILQLSTPKTRLSSMSLLPSTYPGRLTSRNSTLHSRLVLYTAEHLFITSLHGPHRKHGLYC